MAIVKKVEQQGSKFPGGKTTQPFNLKSAATAIKKPDPAGKKGPPGRDVDDGVEASNVERTGSDAGKTTKKKRRFGRAGSPLQF